MNGRLVRIHAGQWNVLVAAMRAPSAGFVGNGGYFGPTARRLLDRTWVTMTANLLISTLTASLQN